MSWHFNAIYGTIKGLNWTISWNLHSRTVQITTKVVTSKMLHPIFSLDLHWKWKLLHHWNSLENSHSDHVINTKSFKSISAIHEGLRIQFYIDKIITFLWGRIKWCQFEKNKITEIIENIYNLLSSSAPQIFQYFRHLKKTNNLKTCSSYQEQKRSEKFHRTERYWIFHQSSQMILIIIQYSFPYNFHKFYFLCSIDSSFVPSLSTHDFVNAKFSLQ